MSIDTEAVKDARAALKAMTVDTKGKLTRQQYVALLIRDIHKKLEAGFQMGEVCAELNKTLPEDQQIKESTFRVYVRSAREEAGIKPLKGWTRRVEKESDKEKSKAVDLVHIEAKKEAKETKSTASGFREMDDEL